MQEASRSAGCPDDALCKVPFASAGRSVEEDRPVRTRDRGKLLVDEQLRHGTRSVEAGEDKWGHTNMAYCENHDGAMPSVAESEAACGTGWHVCAEDEWYAYNDDCDTAVVPFVARLDEGTDCIVAHWTGDARYVCSADATILGSLAGSCGGDGSSSAWSTQADNVISSNCVDTTHVAGGCGTLCCID